MMMSMSVSLSYSLPSPPPQPPPFAASMWTKEQIEYTLVTVSLCEESVLARLT